MKKRKFNCKFLSAFIAKISFDSLENNSLDFSQHPGCCFILFYQFHFVKNANLSLLFLSIVISSKTFDLVHNSINLRENSRKYKFSLLNHETCQIYCTNSAGSKQQY